MDNDISTKEGLLRDLIVVNEHGVYFIKIDDNRYVPFPRWKQAFVKKAMPDAERI